MRVAALSDGVWRGWRRLAPDRRLTAAGSIGVIVSTLGPFSWVEAGEIVVAGAMLLMLERRAKARPFQLPFGDGGATVLAGGWCVVLVVARALERPLLQTLVALACAGAIVGAGMLRRARRRSPEAPTRAL